ncbi:hypothetical protein ACEN8I_18650 [Polaromonas sp. CT11-55]|uniref:hypothetical protein n=1 Tax=Polaromonas sp. CT11-55 TaxID=3243045 RepID=UPI0039A72C78
MRKHTSGGKYATSSRRAWLARAGCLGMGLALPGASRPAGPGPKKPATKAAPKTHYLVSAILREGVQDFTFRLVHSVQSGSSVDEAIGLFTRLVLEKYPGYAIAQTTVTDIVLPPGACTAGKPGSPRKPGLTLYIVSAAMSSSAKDLDTLLVNGWLPGKTADEALARVIRDVKASYPMFKPASTLATELDLTLAGCSAPSPVRSFGERA